MKDKKILTIVKHAQPNLKKPHFVCDKALHPKLDNHPISSLLNKSSRSVAFLGPPGSGKSSLLIGLLQSPSMFKECFETIFLCMPKNSRASIKDSIFAHLPETQVYEEVTLDILQSIYKIAEANGKKGEHTLIIFDDVQKYFRGKGTVEKFLLHMFANRRHSCLTMWFAIQNYKTMTPSMRTILSDLFIFKISKREMTAIFEELIDTHADKFAELEDKILFKHPHDFLFVDHDSQRMFNNWTQEITYEDKDVPSL